MNGPDRFISRTAAARILGCYPQRVTAMIERGELAAYEIAGRVMLRENDIRSSAIPKRIQPTVPNEPE